MSSTNRGVERDIDDAYHTPPALALLICKTLERDFSLEPARVLEPGSGRGSFLRAATLTWPNAEVMGVEISQVLAAQSRFPGVTVIEGDFVLHSPLLAPNLIVGNPPFKHAEAFIEKSLKIIQDQGVVAFILRLNFLGSQERYQKFHKRLPLAHVYVMPARPGFTADGRSDSTEYMVVVYLKGREDGNPTFSWLDNRAIRNRWGKGEAVVPPDRSSTSSGVSP